MQLCVVSSLLSMNAQAQMHRVEITSEREAQRFAQEWQKLGKVHMPCHSTTHTHSVQPDLSRC